MANEKEVLGEEKNTKMGTIDNLEKKAKIGLIMIEESIIGLLEFNHEGMTNTEIANMLGLKSSHEGNQKDYLSYSILGNMMSRNIIYKDKSGIRPLYKLQIK